jgi:phage shock protein A
VLTESYEREVERSTEKLERQFARAQKRAEQAEARLERAKAVPAARVKKHQIALLEQEVELRRAELEEYRRLMNHATRTSGRGAMHRTGREERLEMGEGTRTRPHGFLKEKKKIMPLTGGNTERDGP